MKTEEIAYVSVLTALGIIFSYLESLLPIFTAVPGIKLGLANIVTLYALYTFGFKQAFIISILRIVVVSFLFGSVLTLLYSTAGGLLSLLGMFFLKKTKLLSITAVSIIGAILHNLAQFALSCIILKTFALKYYLIAMLFFAVVSGTVIGILSSKIIHCFQVS